MGKYREVTELARCECCGHLIPSPRYEITKEIQEKKVVVCSEKCFRILKTYKYPKYG
ncbi:MAG: hypothetical protein ACE5PO_05520 [Candidatus Bathyarchaeia archaeon]